MDHRVTDRLPEIQVDLLGHDSEAGFGRFEFLIDVMAEDFHLAAGLVDQRADDADSRCLAGAIRPEQGIKLAGFNGQVYALERLVAVGSRSS